MSSSLENVGNDLAHQAATAATAILIVIPIPTSTPTFEIMDQRLANQPCRQAASGAHANLASVAAHQVLEEAAGLALDARRRRHTGQARAAVRAEARACRDRAHAGGAAHDLLRHAHHRLRPHHRLHTWLRGWAIVRAAVRAKGRARLK